MSAWSVDRLVCELLGILGPLELFEITVLDWQRQVSTVASQARLSDPWSGCESLAVGAWREGFAVVVELFEPADLSDGCFLEEVPHAHAGDAVDDVSACLEELDGDVPGQLLLAADLALCRRFLAAAGAGRRRGFRRGARPAVRVPRLWPG